MKIVHLSESDSGGAGRGAHRIVDAQLADGVDARMWVIHSNSGDPYVSSFARAGKLAGLRDGIQHSISRRLVGRLKTANPVIHTPAIWRSDWPERLNASDVDVVNLHWISNRMLSIKDIVRIRKPLVWTLHDMWAFSGAEHYTDDLRWREGYQRGNRPVYESGFDLNRWTWQRKRRHWKAPIHIVTPSRWLADCARQSALMRDWPVHVVANCLDIQRWQPIDKMQARDLLGLPVGAPLILFGALGGGGSPRKGFDLLLAALGHLRGKVNGLELVVFGQRAPAQPPDLGFPVHYTGHLYDDLSLRALYSAADLLVVPSRQEAFGQTASEAHACGTPVVAFNTGGLPDIVEHQRTGYLAEAFDTEDLATGIRWVLAECEPGNLRANARKRAIECFSGTVVSREYLDIYRQAIG